MARDAPEDAAAIAEAREALDALARGELRARATRTPRGARAVEHFEKRRRTDGRGGDARATTTTTTGEGARDGRETIAPRALMCVFERPRRDGEGWDGSESESESEQRDGRDDGGRGVRDASGDSTVDARFERRGGEGGVTAMRRATMTRSMAMGRWIRTPRTRTGGTRAVRARTSSSG